MLRFLLTRLAALPLSLLLLSLVCFALTRLTPGDPVEQLMTDRVVRSVEDDPRAYEREYARLAARMGRDRPIFYFTATNAALPDTLHRIVLPERREAMKELALRYGNWPRVQEWYRALSAAANNNNDPRQANARRLLTRSDTDRIRKELDQLPERDSLTLAFGKLTRQATPLRKLIPHLHWNGFDNQYNNYLLRLLSLDLGTSYQDRRPVADKIAAALPWTLLLNGLALFFVYLLAVPLGMYMAGHHGSRFDRWTTVFLFLLFGIPSFWVATMLTNFFTTPAFGMDWFPSMGLGNPPEDAGWWETLRIRAAHLFLPVLCLGYSSLAYVSRHLRSAALTELDKPYVQTAKLKGLGRSRVLWGHVFRNASFPLITLLGGLLPAMLAGSILIERIFNLPGMGQLLFSASVARDWPVVIALVLINGLLTAAGLLLADLGYALVDPRVRLKNTPVA